MCAPVGVCVRVFEGVRMSGCVCVCVRVRVRVRVRACVRACVRVRVGGAVHTLSALVVEGPVFDHESCYCAWCGGPDWLPLFRLPLPAFLFT